jgi:hypothetical protein
MKTMLTLIRILLFFTFFSAAAQTAVHSITDLYNQSSRIYQLHSKGKALDVIYLCDSVLSAYKGFPGAEKYQGYLYIYLAEAAKQQGDISLARYSYDLASFFFRPGSEAYDYSIPVNQVSLELEAGRYERCLKNGIALIGFKQFKTDAAKKGILLNNLAAAALASKKYAMADTLFPLLFDLVHQKAAGLGFDSALVYRNFGRYQLAIRKPQEAYGAIKRLLDLYRMQYGNTHYQVAKTWHCLGNVFNQLGQTDSAGICYANAGKAFHSDVSADGDAALNALKLDYETLYFELINDEVDLQRILAFQQKSESRVFILEKSLEEITAAMSRFESVIQNLISSESGFILADKGRQIFDSAIRLSLDLYKETGVAGYLQNALVWSLQAGSVSLQARVGQEERMTGDDSTRALTFRLYRIRQALGDTTDRDSRTAQLKEYQTLKKKLALNPTETMISTESMQSRFRRIRLATGKSSLICYHQMDSILAVFALSHGTMSFSEIPISEELKNSTADFLKMLVSPISANYENAQVQELYRSGNRLYSLLLKPVLGVGVTGDLLIRPDGLIMDLPFEALTMDQGKEPELNEFNEFRDLPFLIKKFRVSYVSGLQQPKSSGFWPFHRKTMEILYCPDDKLAPEIRNEVGWLTQKMPDAKEDDLGSGGFNLRTALNRADIIHFAGHVLLDRDDAFRTVMGCSGPGKGAFQLSELLNIRIRPDLVFINGCESADGINNQGDGKLSPGLFFLLAGASGVIEHRWKAPDISGSMLAREFYTNYPDNTPAAALAVAKRTYLSTCQPGLDHPHYWAGMVYAGPLALRNPKSSSFIWLTLIVVGFIVLIGLFLRKR